MSPGPLFSIILLPSILGNACSDVISSSSSATLVAIARKPCQVPNSKQYYFMSSEQDVLSPNDIIDGSGQVTIIVKCFSQWKEISPNDFAICFDGQWYPSQHTCEQKKCTPLPDTHSALHTCRSANGIVRKCSQPADPGTKATIQCSHWRYMFPDGTRRREISCAQNGEWGESERCEPECGFPFKIINSGDKYTLEPIEHFWLAVIFHFKNGEWSQACVGTVISSFIVITSFNCFPLEDWESTRQPLRIGVGKNSRNYGDYDPSSLYQVGLAQWNDQYTIGLLTVDRYIAFSDTVGSVCFIGSSSKYDRIGLIAVPRKNDNSTVLEGIKSLQLSENKECSDKIRSDEFCSLANNYTFSPNDIGAGLITTNNEGRYIVFGLLSALLNDGRIPVFLNISTELNVKFFDETYDKSSKWVIENDKNWFMRREDDL